MNFAVYLIATALVTYLIRMVPLVAVRQKIKNRYLLSFLYYVPYAVLAVMTIPGIFFSTDSILSAAVGFVIAVVLSYFEMSLITVAASACAAVFVTEWILTLI